MQSDQTVLSLRPGGGGNRGSRLLAPRFDFGGSSLNSSSAASDLPVLPPHGGAGTALSKTGDSWSEGRERIRYTRDQLLQLHEVVEIPEDILKVKKEIEAEIYSEDQTWGRSDASLQTQPQSRYYEPDNRDWRGRSGQLPSVGEERSWDTMRDNKEVHVSNLRPQEINQFNKQDQLSSQFSSKASSQGVGPAPVLIKAEVPWSARRGNLTEKERVLKTVKG